MKKHIKTCIYCNKQKALYAIQFHYRRMKVAQIRTKPVICKICLDSREWFAKPEIFTNFEECKKRMIESSKSDTPCFILFKNPWADIDI